MGGGSNKVDPTAEEVALSQVAVEKWNKFLEQGIPIQNEYIAQATGYQIDTASGELTIDPNGPLNADGSIYTNASAARLTDEATLTAQNQEHATPFNLNKIDKINDENTGGSAAVETSQKLAQQTAVLQGRQNVARMGQGQEISALQSSVDIAQEAQSDAISSANNSFDRASGNGYLAGSVAGAGVQVGLLNRQSAQPTAADDANPPSIY